MGVICLANSYKHQGRCIAGIDEQSGEWVRPISNLDDGRIPLNQAKNISILDIVDISLDYQIKAGHEIENVGYRNSPWQITNKAEIADLLKYREDVLLHPEYGNAIPYKYLGRMSPTRTLQLIEVEELSIHTNSHSKWKAVIGDKKYGLASCELSITDPIILNNLDWGIPVSSHCLLCMSLGQPWKPEDDLMGEKKCYRLIAGVIEILPELKIILEEMNRVDWDKRRGKKYLKDNFNKQSRYQLTASEAKQFLAHLKKLNPEKG